MKKWLLVLACGLSLMSGLHVIAFACQFFGFFYGEFGLPVHAPFTERQTMSLLIPGFVWSVATGVAWVVRSEVKE